MHLMKWLRKNNQKIMAIVVVVLMLGFVGGTALQRFMEGFGTRREQPLATFSNNEKITHNDIALAQQDLSILQTLKTDALLQSIPVPFTRTADLRAVLLSELLFQERQSSLTVATFIKQIRAQGYTISDKQINDFYTLTMPASYYWFLLKTETERAGIKISSDTVKSVLGNLIPKLFSNMTYSQVIGALVNPPAGSHRQGIPEETIISTFGKLLAVLDYARTICSSEDVTEQQVMHSVQTGNEIIDINFVKFDTKVFADAAAEPNSRAIEEQFEKYKDFYAGQATDQNPYGFGYKIPDSIQLQYIAVKTEDVKKIISKPTQQETEEYYLAHRELFTRQHPEDPNDPNSPAKTEIQPYDEVSDSIKEELIQERTSSKIDEIVQSAMSETKGPTDSNGRAKKISEDEFKAMADNYAKETSDLSKKFGLKIYSGQTGLLTASDIQDNNTLGRLYFESPMESSRSATKNPIPVWLNQIVFAVDELAATELGPFDVEKPIIYSNTGPFKDISGNVTAIVRIIKTRKASGPASYDETFSKDIPVLDSNEHNPKIFSVKEKIIEDIKRMQAMPLAAAKAQEFKERVEKSGDWTAAIAELNKTYASKNNTEPNAFQLRSLFGLQRFFELSMLILSSHAAGNPAMQDSLINIKKEQLFAYKLYSLVSPDTGKLTTTPYILEFKPDLCCYCIKDLTVQYVTEGMYDRLRPFEMYKESVASSQSQAIVHFTPENILKRTNFKSLEPKTQITGTAQTSDYDEGY